MDRAAEAEAIHYGGAAARSGLAGLYARLDQKLATLARVGAITDRLPAGTVVDEGWIFGWSEVRLRHMESYVYTSLGDTGRAYAAQERALELYPESLQRERAAMLLHRAACQILDGDVRGGLAYAGDVLDDLPPEQHTELVYAVARRTLKTVPAGERGRAAVAEFAARVASAVASPLGGQA